MGELITANQPDNEITQRGEIVIDGVVIDGESELIDDSPMQQPDTPPPTIYSYGPNDNLVKNIVQAARTAGIDAHFVRQVQQAFHEAGAVAMAAADDPRRAQVESLKYAMSRVAYLDNELLASIANGAIATELERLQNNNGEPSLIGALASFSSRAIKSAMAKAATGNSADGHLKVMLDGLGKIEAGIGNPRWESSPEARKIVSGVRKSINELGNIDSHRVSEHDFMESMRTLYQRMEKTKSAAASEDMRKQMEELQEQIQRIMAKIQAALQNIFNRVFKP